MSDIPKDGLRWHYQAVCNEHGEYWVHEVYEMDDGRLQSENAVRPYGETKEELIDDLRMMLADVGRWGVLGPHDA